jgi:flagellar biosynthesis chaperone FliJ
MAFRFTLETLLRLQRSIEQQEEKRLLACAGQIAGLNAELQAWTRACLQSKETLWSDLRKGTPGAFLQFAGLWEQAAYTQERQLREQLRAAERARQEQLHLYRSARRKRETLESLKDRERSLYTLAYLRRTQQELDEAHLMRLRHRERR